MLHTKGQIIRSRGSLVHKYFFLDLRYPRLLYLCSRRLISPRKYRLSEIIEKRISSPVNLGNYSFQRITFHADSTLIEHASATSRKHEGGKNVPMKVELFFRSTLRLVSPLSLFSLFNIPEDPETPFSHSCAKSSSYLGNTILSRDTRDSYEKSQRNDGRGERDGAKEQEREEQGRTVHNAAKSGGSLKCARFTLQTTTNSTNSANSKAPPIRRCRLKTWPISGENKKEANSYLPQDGRSRGRKRTR